MPICESAHWRLGTNGRYVPRAIGVRASANRTRQRHERLRPTEAPADCLDSEKGCGHSASMRSRVSTMSSIAHVPSEQCRHLVSHAKTLYLRATGIHTGPPPLRSATAQRARDAVFDPVPVARIVQPGGGRTVPVPPLDAPLTTLRAKPLRSPLAVPLHIPAKARIVSSLFRSRKSAQGCRRSRGACECKERNPRRLPGGPGTPSRAVPRWS